MKKKSYNTKVELIISEEAPASPNKPTNIYRLYVTSEHRQDNENGPRLGLVETRSLDLSHARYANERIEVLVEFFNIKRDLGYVLNDQVLMETLSLYASNVGITFDVKVFWKYIIGRNVMASKTNFAQPCEIKLSYFDCKGVEREVEIIVGGQKIEDYY